MEETRDKLIVLKSRAIKFSGRLKNDTDDEQAKLDDNIVGELPAFAYYLDNYKIKSPCVRFGQAGFINQDAEFEIEDNEEHTALWTVMKKFLFRGAPKTVVGKGAARVGSHVDRSRARGP
mgnify:CR=1 FL=1